MATIEVLVTPEPDRAGEPVDPFRYGWRTVERRREDGTTVVEQLPLTLLDVLHPEEGDQVTHAEAHERRCVYLYDVFSARLAADATAVVLHDVRVAWDVPGLRPHGPDIAVILGVRERRNWGTFDVAVEGVRPALIVEVTSPETASLDRSTKLEQYDEAGVALYVIVDTIFWRHRPAVRLLGYRQTPDGYQPMVPDEQGRLWLAPVRAWLGVEENEIVCYDEAGRPLGDYRTLAATVAMAEQAQAAEAAARAEAERARTEAERRADAAETRLRELEAEVRRLRGESA